MKKMVLHIGFHKTASTSLQKALQRQRDMLLEYDVYFEERDGQAIAFALADNDIAKAEQIISHYKQLPYQKYIISSEGLPGSFVDGYAEVKQHAAYLRNLLDGFEVVVLGCTRRQDSFLESAYQQLVKQGDCSDFAAFQAQIELHAFHWQKIVAPFAEQFGAKNLTLLPYEQLFDDHDAVMHAMLNQLDIPTDAFSMAGQENLSLSPRGLRYAKLLRYVPQRHLRYWVRRGLQYCFPKKPGDNFGIFSEQERQALLDHYRDSNQALFTDYILDAHYLRYYLGEADS